MKTAVRRYTIRALPGAGRWGVYDEHLGAFCALPGEAEPLDWPAAQGAQEWLYLCRVAWGGELLEAPQGWNFR